MVLVLCIFYAFVSSSMLDRAAAQDTLCADTIPDCRSYGREVCVNYADWAKINCASSCTYCTGPTAARECRDFVANCATFAANLCTSPQYRVWAEDHCPLFCGFCAATTSTSPNPPDVTSVVTTDTSAKPTDTSAKPTDTSAKPTDTSAKPPDSSAKPSGPSTKPTVSTVTVPINAPCEDKINFCLVYSKRACTDIAWADSYCRKWCARC